MTGAATGLDFASVMAIGGAQGVDLALLAEALPDIEIAMIAAMNGEDEEE